MTRKKKEKEEEKEYYCKICGVLIEDEDKKEKEKAKEYTTFSDSKMILGIGQEITNHLCIFATDPRVRKTLIPSENQLIWDEDCKEHNIFISVPEDRLEQYGGVLAMMLTQLIRTLERRREKYSPAGKKQPPILLMLDEFPRLGKMEVITSAVSTLRSKGVTICLVMQSLAQLDLIYGENIRRIILENWSNSCMGTWTA